VSLGERDERYPPIADHGVVGDLRTVALVSLDGTIDFLCLPDFDSPTVFARLLDAARGGHFSIGPAIPGVAREQRYVRDTTVLVTRFVAKDAEVELVDFMPLDRRPDRSRMVRLVRATRGEMRLGVVCAPRFDYGRSAPTVTLETGRAIFAGVHGERLRLTTTAPLTWSGSDVVAELSLRAGKRLAFVLEAIDDTAAGPTPNDRWAARALRRTVVFWRRWVARCRYRGEWSGAVRRSALTLKLLQSRRTGGIVAAPTFGLPEQIGGTRNWDFRYSWIRDAAFTVYALARLGLADETKAFIGWIAQRCEEAETPGSLQSIYGIDGRRALTEQTLEHLEGYRGSRPVRIGNAAYDQLQLDIYGELIDALYLHDEYSDRTSHRLWQHITELTEWVCSNWRRPDEGIWEVRTGSQEFLYSRVMCWVAVDRALRIARRRRFAAPFDRWRSARDAIRDDVNLHFWNDRLGAFVGSKSSDTIDAACLVMPLVGFISATDPRWLSTLREVEKRLVRDSLVRRYDMLGMDTDAGSLTAPTFTICSFWYVECLARSGEPERARSAMGHLLGHANHLGLFSEDLGVDGEQLGNFPQGLTHAALIGAAMGRQERRDINASTRRFRVSGRS
jgi:GH15 family glucan-1,4-alpha-glucosidase